MVMLLERCTFKIAVPYPIKETLWDSYEKIEIPIDPKDLMRRLADLVSAMPVTEVRVTMKAVQLSIAVKSFEEQSGTEQLQAIERVLVEHGFAPRSKWL